ncbi:hypothetical protein F66182_2307 [Fusarium sp. NRRL 66182]|nr:hypothetical protein F66182_2307 [Fusarium sp. NRRL 66182]
MRFSIAAATAALLALAEARISFIQVPTEIKVGEPFQADIIREGYIQSVYDVAIVFGYAPADAYPGTIGQPIDSFYLGPDESNKDTTLKKFLTVPTDAPKGKGLITASWTSLYGVSGSPTITNYNVTVTFV